jgi:hypothetical protein
MYWLVADSGLAPLVQSKRTLIDVDDGLRNLAEVVVVTFELASGERRL